MTVSRVINGNKSKVSEETARKIMEIIKKYNYVPNSSARSLSSKNSRIVSVIFGGYGNYLTDAYFSTMFSGITQHVQSHGYHTMVNYVNDYHDITRLLHTWNADGAIFLGIFDNDILKIKEDNQIPLVFTDSYSPVRQITNVGIDDYKGGVLAAKHFIERGHRNFAFVGPSLGINFSGVVQHRLQGFKDTITNAGLTLKSEHILSVDEDINVIEKILHSNEPITAIFATSDMIAIDLIDKITSMGLQVPKDYSIIGFDNLPLSYYVTPKLTTIAQDINLKAKLASDILFRHMNDLSLPSESIVLDVHLIERASVRSIR
ncbi:LacI family transcriptional regulator [Clostridium sp. SYSU_GA19001]|nr:LacI family transcriptional regulator [Clostridium caldaquaticum]